MNERIKPEGQDEGQALAEVRKRIDAIDLEILRLINERARCAQQVARIKTGSQGGSAQFYRPEREIAILRRIKEVNPGPLDSEEVARLFREIMSACLALERPLRAAFLGPEGTFTQAAAIKHFGHSVITQAMATIDEIFREVESGACDFGVVPVENSTEGVVSHTLDLFMTSPLMITGEVCLRVHHYLLSKATELASIRRIYSHQQSLAQCREWLDRHLPLAERLPVGSNAEAARLVGSDPEAAAVASLQASEIYGLGVLAERIEDEPSNTTRFLVIGKQDSPPSGQDKTSLLLSCKNQAGGLHKLLAPLAVHGISMTRIESRPSRRGLWDYVFFVDILGHRQDPSVAYALQTLEQEALLFKVLGSYPVAVL
ncbi:MAG: prephenate dehydratase [Thermochromatium sp.]